MSNFSNYANAIVKKMNEFRTNVFLECEYVIPENTNVPPKRNYLNKFKNDSKYASYNIEKKKNQKRGMKNKIIESDLIIVKDNLEEHQDILTDNNIFNIINKETTLMKWKDVKIEDKKIKIKEFIDITFIDFPEELLNKIYHLIDINKINFKKYIDFNESTKNINKMPIIFIKNREYALNYSSIKKKKRKKITF